MDDTRFDDMAKALGSVTTRRLAIGALLGGVLGRVGLAEAKNSSGTCQKCDKDKCEKKNGKKVCKQGKCKSLTGTACTVASGAEGTCQSGTCVITCAPPLANCGGVCRNLQTDIANCGTCGTVCPANQVCQSGSCFPKSTCPATSCCCNCVSANESGGDFISACHTDVITREECRARCGPGQGHGFGCVPGPALFRCGRTGSVDCTRTPPNVEFPTGCACLIETCST